MDNKNFVLALFQEGALCSCRKNPKWDRIYDENGDTIGYELQHKETCEGRIKASELLRELQNVEN